MSPWSASSAPPTPPTGTGTLEICKLASGKGVAGSFAFRIEGRPGTIDVPVGGCSLPVILPVGQTNVTEVARPGFTVGAISAIPTTQLVQSDLPAGTAKVDIAAGGVENQTILTFTNKARPKGWLEVCKVKPAGDSLTGRFNFTVSQVGSPTQDRDRPGGRVQHGYAAAHRPGDRDRGRAHRRPAGRRGRHAHRPPDRHG